VPSRQFYVNCEAMGLLFAMGAFIGEELVGYAAVTVRRTRSTRT
jgi:hypothetical protein